MTFISVLAAAAAAYAFGAFWYMTLAKPWMKAVGFTHEQVEGGMGKDPKPFIISAIMVVIVAGMMRHMFAQAGVVGAGESLLAGLGLGAFIATPWIITNYGYAGKPIMLSLIDGGYATIGCSIMGLVLGLFSTSVAM